MKEEVLVVGRVSYDLNPLESKVPLEEVRTFERSVGGFGGNVVTGLARLGVPTAIVSAVGDDPHGRYVDAFLSSEGVDTSLLFVNPTLRTPLAFYESWPPDEFPVTLFRSPTAPDWEIQLADLPAGRFEAAKMVLFSGTGLARQSSLDVLRAIARTRASTTMLDLDWRPAAWEDPDQFGPRVRELLPYLHAVVGGDQEFQSAKLEPGDLPSQGVPLVVVKHGPAGATVIDDQGETTVQGIPVEVACALGAGDAFLAALAAGLYRGLSPLEAVRRANVAGAIVVTRPMCSPAMPTLAELDVAMDVASVASY